MIIDKRIKFQECRFRGEAIFMTRFKTISCNVIVAIRSSMLVKETKCMKKLVLNDSLVHATVA